MNKLEDDCVSCSHCCYFVVDPKDSTGFCRRYPPNVVISNENEVYCALPVVESTDYCGEFKRKLH